MAANGQGAWGPPASEPVRTSLHVYSQAMTLSTCSSRFWSNAACHHTKHFLHPPTIWQLARLSEHVLVPLAIVNTGGYCICDLGVNHKNMSRTAGRHSCLRRCNCPPVLTSTHPLLLLPSCIRFSTNADTFRAMPLHRGVRVQSHTRQESA